MTDAFVRTEGFEELQWMGKTRLRVLADSASTGGQFTMIEEFCGDGDASPLHVHEDEDETFWLLEGSMLAWVGDKRYEVGPGGLVFLPRTIPHAYRFTSDNSRCLMIATPGGIEEMFREAGWDLSRPAPDDWSVSMPLLKEITDRRRTPLLGPPPAV